MDFECKWWPRSFVDKVVFTWKCSLSSFHVALNSTYYGSFHVCYSVCLPESKTPLRLEKIIIIPK